MKTNPAAREDIIEITAVPISGYRINSEAGSFALFHIMVVAQKHCNGPSQTGAFIASVLTPCPDTA